MQEKSVTVRDAAGNVTEIHNFDTTYAAADDNTITITNTKKPQGILLPGTGREKWLDFLWVRSRLLADLT